LATYKSPPFQLVGEEGVELGEGTDNDIALNTSCIRELLGPLVTGAENLKITKLSKPVTGETRSVLMVRPPPGGLPAWFARTWRWRQKPGGN
jgi:hypothetical protein